MDFRLFLINSEITILKFLPEVSRKIRLFLKTPIPCKIPAALMAVGAVLNDLLNFLTRIAHNYNL